jgi:hypothetical protein
MICWGLTKREVKETHEILPLSPPFPENPLWHHQSQEAGEKGIGHHRRFEAIPLVDEPKTENQAEYWL